MQRNAQGGPSQQWGNAASGWGHNGAPAQTHASTHALTAVGDAGETDHSVRPPTTPSGPVAMRPVVLAHRRNATIRPAKWSAGQGFVLPNGRQCTVGLRTGGKPTGRMATGDLANIRSAMVRPAKVSVGPAKCAAGRPLARQMVCRSCPPVGRCCQMLGGRPFVRPSRWQDDLSPAERLARAPFVLPDIWQGLPNDWHATCGMPTARVCE